MTKLTKTQIKILKDIVEQRIFTINHDIAYWTDSLRRDKDNVGYTLNHIKNMNKELNELEKIKI